MATLPAHIRNVSSVSAAEHVLPLFCFALSKHVVLSVTVLCVILYFSFYFTYYSQWRIGPKRFRIDQETRTIKSTQIIDQDSSVHEGDTDARTAYRTQTYMSYGSVRWCDPIVNSRKVDL